MAAEKVEVYTRSWRPEAEGVLWSCDGSGSYTVDVAEGQRRGTKIIIHLKEDSKEYAQNWRLKSIVEKYSSYIEFPIQLDGEQLNTQEAIWLKDKAELDDEAYAAFYKFQSGAFDEPLTWMHFCADVPLEINALVYVPSSNTEMPGMPRQEPAVALHCRKVLIDPAPREFLPEWLRFLKGVVDSADLPLNISRESMQDSALVKKLGQVIIKRFCKHLERLSTKDAGTFEAFYKQFSVYLKEGAATDFTYRDQLTPLLRYESTATEPGELTSLQAYLDRMKDDQKAIYFLVGPSRAAIESGPYLEAFKARGIEVLFCYEPIDDFVMSNLGQFKEKQLTSADSDDIDLGELEESPEGEPLPEAEVKALCAWLKDTLGAEKVTEVEVGSRLVGSPVIALNADKMMNASMRRLMKAMGNEAGEAPVQVKLQINPRHSLIHNLHAKQQANPEVASLMAAQLLDNALISAGLLEDPRSMVSRMNDLLARL
jgi:molecular chaperone HtpG